MRGKFFVGAASAALIAMAFAAPATAQQIDPPGDNTTQARANLGQDISGALDAPGDTDWYRLNVEQGQRYRITLDAAPGEGEQAIDPLIVVYGADGVDLAYNDDAGGTLNSALNFTPSSGGEVFIEARGFDPAATGGYRLRVEASAVPPDDAGSDASSTARVTPGRAVNGAIEYEGDSDWYRLSARTGQIYRISLNGAGEEGAALGDPLLRIVGADGAEIAGNDDSGGTLNSYLEFTPTRSGDVFVVAGAFLDGSAGAYTLNVEAARLPRDNAGADTSTRGRIQPGQSIDQTIDYAGDRDWYRVRLEGGQAYRFNLSSSGASPLPDPLLRLYDARGNEVAMDDDGGGELNSLIEFVAPATGNYFVEAGGYVPDMQGGYTLRLREGDIPADNTTDVSVSAGGDYREGVLAPNGDRDWYRVDLEAGQSLRIALNSGEAGDALGDPYIVLYGPDSQEVARDDDGGEGLNAWLEYTAVTGGTHFIEARGFGDDAAGRYFLVTTAGEIGQGPDGAEPLMANGEGRVSSIGTNGDVDWFVIEMIEGRPYRFNLEGVDPDALADPYLTLYNSSGEQVATDDDGGIGVNAYLTFASPTGGPHFVGVSSFGDTGTGRYALRVTDTDVPGHIYTDENLDPAGDERGGRIEMPGDLDYFRVELEGGVAYTIDVRGAGDNPLADAYLTILDADNTRITSDDDGGSGLDARLRFTPTQAGTYYIQASGLGGSTGGYTVSIAR